MLCPGCGHEILDPDPRFCPRCGYEFVKPAPVPPSAAAPGASTEAGREARSVSVQAGSAEGTIPARYYLLVFLAVVGGVIGYRAVKKYNPRVAATIFTIGLLISFVYIGAGYEIYSRPAGPVGTYDLAITAIGFPNSTAVVVIVANQGTLEDGLESVAINNGSLWLVYGLLSPNSPQASSELQTGNLDFSLYGYILNNGTTLPAGSAGSATVGTEGFPPGHVDQVTVPFSWRPESNYTVFISTHSAHPYETTVVSPV